MSLETYRKKRNFSATPEPDGAARKKNRPANGKSQPALSFVIQKHDARRLHYDFRLELDGVLKSWAVTRGPSLVPGEKRLAVHVEDHPLDYGGFEGVIPKGEYGGGPVMVWDRGTWSPEGDPHQGYKKGKLTFALDGEKLHGRWHLARMRGKLGEKRENWLLIKGDDAYARTADDPDILEEAPSSVASGRSMTEIAAGRAPAAKRGDRDAIVRADPVAPRARKSSAGAKPDVAAPDAGPAARTARARKGAKAAAMPAFIKPMLASLADTAPQGRRWLHEIKFDGYRLQAHVAQGEVKLLTRSGYDWSERFGDALIEALSHLPVDSAVIDGELVSATAQGGSDFSALQEDLAAGRVDRFAFYVFDLMHLDGVDLRSTPLTERKALLQGLTAGSGGLVRFSAHFDEEGDIVLRHACRLSLEGVISKVRDAPYRSGRSKSWIKSKCTSRQEFVIGGYTPSSVSRGAIGSLALGVYEGKSLRHVGRVGTGFSNAVAADLFQRLHALERKASPFANRLDAAQARQLRYVQPKLVAEVAFRGWTGDGHLRHASFRGLREDKPASEIVREAPAATTPTPSPASASVRMTHPDRVYWPDAGVTKEGLADYYSSVWRYMEPHVVGRPLALLRCPNGVYGQTFFQKHAWRGMSRHILSIAYPADAHANALIGIGDIQGLMGLVQAAALEIHPWGARFADWEHPDQIVMDLDPGDGVAWRMTIDAAIEIKRRLEEVGLTAFVKTSGGKGLHVVAPLRPRADWPTVKSFCKELAQAMAADSPRRYVATATKSRRRGRIFIDYLRNQRGATAIAPYATRARPGAAVATPLSWAELSTDIGPDYFTVANMPARLAALATDPWEGFRDAAAPLEPTPRG